jgi:7-cyano-7-deazaguanine synthase in queuosine biosynthesis
VTGARVLMQCDGAPVPDDVDLTQFTARETINRADPDHPLNLYVQPLHETVWTNVAPYLDDLLHVAAVVFAADQMVSRGGTEDPNLRAWHRELTLCIPVADPDRWNRPAVHTALRGTLDFLTEDTWDFHFAPAAPAQQQFTLFDAAEERRRLDQPTGVVLLSGGIDSLCATVEAVTARDLRPLLVSHVSQSGVKRRQLEVAAGLRKRLGWSFPHLAVRVNQRRLEARERTRRSRGFLHAAIGAAVATELGIGPIHLADNGIVSLGLGVNASVVGAQASRNTHPKFLARFNTFLSELVGDPAPARVENSLWNKTRAEALAALKAAGCAPLIAETVSCSRTRNRPVDQRQCGYCSQCVDRRFGVIGARLERHDPMKHYGRDIFYEALREGEERTVPVSYLRRARLMRDTPREQLFDVFPELGECIPAGSEAIRVASELADLLHRHAAGVDDVISYKIERAHDRLGSGRIPASALVRIAQDALTGTTPRPAGGPATESSPAAVEMPPTAGVRAGEGAIPPPGVAVPQVNRFYRRGPAWEMAFACEEGHEDGPIKATMGAAYLHRLLTTPGEFVDVLDLVAITQPTASPEQRARLTRAFGAETAQDIIDHQARRAYQQQITDLDDRIAEAEGRDDLERAAQLDQERADLIAHIGKTLGLGGRRRTFSRSQEKARKSVRKDIIACLTVFERHYPLLTAHLHESLRYGKECAYAPSPMTHWQTVPPQPGSTEA